METSISNYLLTQGVLGLAVLVLGIVVVYQQRKLDKKDTSQAEEVKLLNQALLAEIKAHTVNYQDMAKREQEVLSDVSQSMALFSEKIEVVKGRK
jgi:type VI protein secretion system component VasK